MKLSRQQINFIEDYLIKNKVKFWDVRIELLDHVATEIEDRIQQGQTFDDALKEIHQAFGNKMRSKKLNKNRTEWIFNESIYADNSGYKKLIMEKQKELNRGFRKSLFTNLLMVFKNPLFWLIYGIVGFSLFQSIQHATNVDFIKKIIFLSLFIIPAIQMAIPFLFCFKGSRHSLYLNLLTTSSLMLMNIPNIMLYWWERPSPWVYVFLYTTLAPILIAQTLMIIQHSKKYKQFYLKWKRAS
ncbi:hypothetical protein [Flagellimonas onchidii]|uniref:hypothetical protein n=1 Tax=Flagellimonas onchidii TaxID=2562684 RepID=UPI0010A5B638|nr:hypothetical protein [Allomuricauda onchidii]